jgi:tetratricopeptide (TPR) repeat protein
VYLQIGQFADALERYRQSLEIRTKIEDRRGTAVSLANIARVQKIQGRHADAIRTSKEALELRQSIGDPRGIATEWRNLGEIHEAAGQVVEAQRCYQESLKIVRDLDDVSLLALNFSNLGYIASVLGNYVEAYIFYQEALAKRREAGDKGEVLRTLIDLGLIEHMQGRYDKALAYAAEAMGLAGETGEKAGRIVLSVNVGMIHDDQGSYAPALKSLTEAVEGARSLEDRSLIASALLYLGRTLGHLGRPAEAEEILAEAERFVVETENAALWPELLNEQAEIQGGRGDLGGCLKTLAEARAKAQQIGDRRLLILSRLNLGKWGLAAGRPEARAHLRWAVAEAGKSALQPLHLRALASLSSAGLSGARPDPAAAAAAEQIIGEGKALNLRESLVLASWVLARRAKARGDHQAATRMFLEAGQTVREMADGLGEPYLSALLGRADLSRLSEEARAHISRRGDPADKEKAAKLFARPTA